MKAISLLSSSLHVLHLADSMQMPSCETLDPGMDDICRSAHFIDSDWHGNFQK